MSEHHAWCVYQARVEKEKNAGFNRVRELVPDALWHIVWGFLWKNWDRSDDPLHDVEVMADIQRSIPPCFLRDRVKPLLDLGDREKYGSASQYQLYPLSPYRTGNPYFPTQQIDRRAMFWSLFPSELMMRLSREGFRTLKTYPVHASRRLTAHYNRPVEGWNTSLVELFFDMARLKPELYNLDGSAYVFIPLLEQLSQCQFLELVTSC